MHGNENYPFQFYLEDIWEFDFHCVDWHWHPELEFVYVEKGTATILAGSNKYILPQGNAIFINTQVIHRFESAASAIIPNIVFSPTLLAPRESLIYQKYVYPIVASSADSQTFSPEVPWQKEILETLKAIFLLQKKEEPCELQTVQLLLRLWQGMYENMKAPSAPQGNKTDIQDQARLQIMLQYIHENYQKDITLEQLAREVSLSKSSILRIFHEYVAMSPIDYVIHYKLKQAAQLLDTTENTVSTIAESTGFDNVGYFCRKFKDVFQLTPSQYRNAKRRQ